MGKTTSGVAFYSFGVLIIIDNIVLTEVSTVCLSQCSSLENSISHTHTRAHTSSLKSQRFHGAVLYICGHTILCLRNILLNICILIMIEYRIQVVYFTDEAECRVQTQKSGPTIAPKNHLNHYANGLHHLHCADGRRKIQRYSWVVYGNKNVDPPWTWHSAHIEWMTMNCKRANIKAETP